MNKIFIISCICILNFIPAYPQGWQWAFGEGTFSYESVADIATDASGNSFLIGNFSNSFMIDTVQVPSNGTGFNIFIAKINSDGHAMWAKSFPTNMNISNVSGTRGVTVDVNGGLFITGNFILLDTISFGNIICEPVKLTNAYVVRADADGKPLWAGVIGCTGAIDCYAISSDDKLNSYVCGEFTDSLFVDGNVFTTSPSGNAFIAKYDSVGSFVWLRMVNGDSNQFEEVVYRNGKLFLAGQFDGVVYDDDDTLTSAGATDVLIAVYDTSGNNEALKSAGGPGDDGGNAICVDYQMNYYVAGVYGNPAASFDTISIPYLSGDDFSGFLASYNSNNDVSWVQYESSIHGNVFNRQVKCGPTFVYVSGVFSDTLMISAIPNVYHGPGLFTLVYNTHGGYYQQVIDTLNTVGLTYQMDYYSSESIYFAGTHESTFSLANFNIPSVAGSDIFVAQLINAHTGIPTIENTNDDLIIYPNPSTGKIYFRTEQSKGDCEIYNVTGQLIRSFIFRGNDVLEFSLPDGIYIIRCLFDDEVICRKFIVER